ncbi:MAG: hypothetical protein HY695_34615 [Deltaproteobacteria bacterium]|nr:hypothetical protein [Deltaproteobacteria bacterium]
MQNFDLAPIIILIIFLLIPLLNYILKRMGRRFEDPTPRRQPTPDMGLRRQAAPSSPPAANRDPAHVTPPTEAMTPRVTASAVPNQGRGAARNYRDNDPGTLSRLRPARLSRFP